MIEYRIEAEIPLDALQDLWQAANFTEGMPESQWDVLDKLIHNSTFSMVAFDGEVRVGLVRVLTDYMDLCQIADILVAKTHQRRGIGSELLRRTLAELEPGVQVFVHAASDAMAFYAKVGFVLSGDVMTVSVGS